MKAVQYFIALVLLGIAALLMAKAWTSFDHSRRLVATTELAEGTVVHMKPFLGGRVGKGKLLYFPEVRFTTADGHQVQFLSRESRRADHFREGDKVPVRYDPASPTQAVIATFSALWALPLIYAAGGLLLLLFGSWFLKQAVARGRRD
jgi:hypothetical protein